MGVDDYCCVPLCNHKRRRNGPCKTFYTIPREPQQLYKQWQARIKRVYRDENGKIRPWEATDNHRICDCHFTGEEKATILHPKCRKPGRKNVLPSIFPGRITSTAKAPRTTTKSTNRAHISQTTKRPRKLYFATPIKNEDIGNEPVENGSPDHLQQTELEDTCSLEQTVARTEVEAVEHTVLQPDGGQPPGLPAVPHGHDYLSTMVDKSSFKLLDEDPSLKEVLWEAKKNEKMADKFKAVNKNGQLLSLENVKSNLKLFKFYTGFSSYEVFEALFKYLEPKASSMKYPYGERTVSHAHFQSKFSKKPGAARNFSLREELFMTLVRLRIGVPVADIAVRYGIADSTFSSIFTAWVCLLAIELEKICKVTNSNSNSTNIANCFSEFQNVKIILDCTELFAETPSSLAAHKQLFSNYKHHNTMKFLVGMSAGGAITYISEMYGGHSSDKFITNESTDLLRALNTGEKVMVDRGFTIAENLPPGVSLIMPSFKHKNKTQFTKEEVKRNKKISEARVHIERAIRRIKQFEIFSKAVKLSQKDIYENMFKAYGYLVNFQDPFLKV